MLVSSLREEDRLLRRTLTLLTAQAGRRTGCDNLPNCKETLGHIAYWDSYLVQYIRCKLNAISSCLAPPIAFEDMDHLALEKTRTLSFQEVLAGYRDATHSLLVFLETHWDDLSERQRRNMRVPLRHRRHHRIGLDQSLCTAEVDLAGLVASA